MNERSLHGVIVLDKPGGWTSNRVMGRVGWLLGLGRRKGGKIGFLGTLDPLATGVLPIFTGKATRLIPLFEGLEKTYRATIRLGESTDTFDSEGRVTRQRPLEGLTPERVEQAIRGFAGFREQSAPPFSAVKQDGVASYRLARQGKEVQRRVKKVHIRLIEPEKIELPEASFRVTVSAGTYIRTLADDIGEELDVGAHVTALRRLDCGNLFTEEKSITLERLEELAGSMDRKDPLPDLGFILNPVGFLREYSPLEVAGQQLDYILHGRAVALAADGGMTPGARAMALDTHGALVAVGRLDSLPGGGLEFRPEKVLA
ncbi:MAG: tRNA pseudouridine(55) synthase TruB [Deltaproteobacteria bacterium]|nr:tRNA pseudouridine(55) synthase TruB [Deltaproteobacteria bacterium]